MATRIRLQRHGRKSYAFYSIVIADSRAPRDGDGSQLSYQCLLLLCFHTRNKYELHTILHLT